MTNKGIFPKGSSFSCSAYLPDTVPEGFFEGWHVKAQMRRKGDSTDIGIVAELFVDWVDPGTNRQLIFYCGNTDHWPVCLVTVDVLFTNIAGEQLRTSAIEIDIQQGVTQ